MSHTRIHHPTHSVSQQLAIASRRNEMNKYPPIKHIPPFKHYEGSLMQKEILKRMVPPEYTPATCREKLALASAVVIRERTAYAQALAFCYANPDWPMDTIVAHLVSSYGPMGLTEIAAIRVVNEYVMDGPEAKS